MILVLFVLSIQGSLAVDYRRHLSTKTPYVLREKFGNRPLKRTDDVVFLTGVVRHGTRWPTSKTLHKYNKFKKHQKSGFLWDSVNSQAGELHEQGHFEMYGLGQRLKTCFPSVFSSPFSTSNFLFTSTGKTRTTMSAIAFGMGAFPEICQAQQCLPSAIGLQQKPLESDTLLRFFDVDPDYQFFQKTLKQNLREAFSEVFYEEIRQRLAEVSRMTGEAEMVGELWDVCEMEASLLNTTDFAFCSVFSKEVAEIFEWTADFEKFIRSGAGHSINCCLAQPLLQHLVASLEEASQGKAEEGRLAQLYFAHAETLLPLACLLGIPNQQNWTLSNVLSKLELNPKNLDQSSPLKKHLETPIWRCQEVSPMGANFFLGLSFHHQTKEPMVKLYWNEELLSGPWCNGKTECSLKEFKSQVLSQGSHFGDCQCTSHTAASCNAPWHSLQ